jgi:hypothetical protein
MEVNMTRRKMLLVTAGATVLGLAALIGFADHNAIFADDDDDEGREGLIKLLDTSKVNLQQGLAAGEQRGQPISAKFEVDDGKLQLSVYAAKEGKFFEVLINYMIGQVLRVEPITEGDDLAAASSQSAAMAAVKGAFPNQEHVVAKKVKKRVRRGYNKAEEKELRAHSKARTPV